MIKVKGFQDTIAWYNQNAKQYTQVSAENANPEQIEQFSNLLPKNGKVLDAGCGSGRDTNLLVQKGLDVVGLDVSQGLIQEAKIQFPTLQFIEGNLLNLPFNNNMFDGVWAHASLLHLETIDEVKTVLKEFHRVLKNKGILHVLVKAQSGKQKTAVVSDAFSNHNRFFQYFTQEELTELLKTSGFTIRSIEQYRETDRNPHGRSEVQWILALAEVERR
jgi:ubiquinone/menaquinone biosynthesis C-methylase UbiE